MSTPPDFGYQPELKSARLQTAWQVLLRDIYHATSKANADARHYEAVGFVRALYEADLINASAEGVMGMTGHRTWIEALERLDDATGADEVSA